VKHYWEYGEQDKATRRKYNTGDILENAAECLDCGTYIRSNNRHDFKVCKCGKVAVDGGSWYAKRSFSEGARFRDIVIPYKDDEAAK
jgi:hypothetical protein